MKTNHRLLILAISLIFLACVNRTTTVENAGAFLRPKKTETKVFRASYNLEEYKNTKGYWENGEIINSFDCPDSRFFPPIDIKSWDKIPVVNGRFPTYAETMDGTSIHHYGEKANAYVKPYDLTLPKLAYKRTWVKIHNSKKQAISTDELVVVIQIVQTAKDTIVGFRYLSGGCGGSLFYDFHFLSDEEVKKVTSL